MEDRDLQGSALRIVGNEMHVLNLLSRIILVSCSILLAACGGESFQDPVEPVTKPRSELQAEIQLIEPQANLNFTRLYRENQRLFGIAKDQGVQIIDNSEPDNPTAIAFMKMDGIEDVVIEGDTLVTNQYADIVVFSQSLQKEVGRISNVYDYQNYVVLPSGYYWPEDIIVPEGEVVVGYHIPAKEKEKSKNGSCWFFCW